MSKIETTVTPFHFARGPLDRAHDLHATRANQSQRSERKKFQQAQRRKEKQSNKLLMAQLSMMVIAGFAVGKELSDIVTENTRKILGLLPQVNFSRINVDKAEYVAVEAPFKISDEFAAIIDAKIDYEESAIEDILSGDFIGPLPETEHNLCQDFQSGALGNEQDYKKQMKALRGIVEYGGRSYLTENLFNQLAQENAELTLEGDRPTIVFRLTQPSFRFSPDRRATNELIPIHVPK